MPSNMTDTGTRAGDGVRMADTDMAATHSVASVKTASSKVFMIVLFLGGLSFVPAPVPMAMCRHVVVCHAHTSCGFIGLRVRNADGLLACGI